MVNSIESVSTGSAEGVHNNMDPAGSPLSARLHKSKHSVKHKGGRRRRKRRRRRRTRKKRGGYNKNNFEDLVGQDIWIAYQEFQTPIFSLNMLTEEKVYIDNDFYIKVKIIDANPDHLRVGLLYDPPITDDVSDSGPAGGPYGNSSLVATVACSGVECWALPNFHAHLDRQFLQCHPSRRGNRGCRQGILRNQIRKGRRTHPCIHDPAHRPFRRTIRTGGHGFLCPDF